jgi:hypothetical protein
VYKENLGMTSKKEMSQKSRSPSYVNVPIKIVIQIWTLAVMTFSVNSEIVLVAENKKLAYFDVWETSILKPWSSL